MFLAGSNFALFYLAIKEKSLRTFWRNVEFRFYFRAVLFFILIFAVHLIFVEDLNLGNALTLASFKVISAITTTGFTIYDYENWSSFLQTILIVLMFIGGCNGSTSGSIKIGRYIIIFKQALAELRQAIHPRAVLNLKVDGKFVEESILINAFSYFFLFIFFTILGTLFLTFLGLDMLTSFSATVASITNTGLGFSLVGPGQNFSVLPDAGKYALAFLMLLGRLEIYTVLVVFSLGFWKK
jgi:trk system potassium uptake protein TrkH